MNRYAKFLRDEAGVATVELAALTAVILLLSIVAVYEIFDGVRPLTQTPNINTTSGSGGVGVDINSAPDLNGSRGDDQESQGVSEASTANLFQTQYRQPPLWNR